MKYLGKLLHDINNDNMWKLFLNNQQEIKLQTGYNTFCIFLFVTKRQGKRQDGLHVFTKFNVYIAKCKTCIQRINNSWKVLKLKNKFITKNMYSKLDRKLLLHDFYTLSKWDKPYLQFKNNTAKCQILMTQFDIISSLIS